MKKGFTLIELLVYMVIMGFIIVVAGRVFSDSTSMRVRTQSMTKASEEANRIAETIKEDLSQMGAKVWKDEDAAGTTVFKNVEGVYISTSSTAGSGDSSSFNLTPQNANGHSDIEFKKISYNEDGKYIGIRVIRWHVDNGILYRSCRTIEPSSLTDPELAACPAEAAPVAMAENVKTFILNPSKPLDNDDNFGIPAPTTSNPATFSFISYHLSGTNFFATGITQPAQDNFNTATLEFSERNNNDTEKKQHQVYVAPLGTPSSANINACKIFEFKKGETYAIKFKTPNYSENSIIALFQPGVDHAAVGFRGTNGNDVPGMPSDFMFYPAQDRTADYINQYFEFSVPSDKSACIAFTFAFYSGTDEIGPHKIGENNGKLKIQDVELLNKKDGKYEFKRDNVETFLETPENKKNVKAFELILEVEKGKEIGSTRKEKDENGKDVGYVIPVPNNGVIPALCRNKED